MTDMNLVLPSGPSSAYSILSLFPFSRNVPGAAMYFTVLNESRTLLARRKINGQERTDIRTGTSALPKLSNAENLVAGGASRAAIGFVMMPATVIKVRYEVCLII
jgi:solute carrier family 25 protein 38